MVIWGSYKKKDSCFSAVNSGTRTSLFNEILGLINRYGSLSLYEQMYVISLVQHKLKEREKNEKK